MSQEQLTIGYDEYMSLPLEKRNEISDEISADNYALLMKTHVEGWLDANHPRLDQEKIAVIEELLSFITPEMYQAKRDYMKVMQKAEKIYSKAATVFSQEEIMQFGFLSGGQCPTSQAEND